MPSNLMMAIVTISLTLFICLDPTLAFWRLPCNKPITVQRLDPIVTNGTVSTHIHTVMGGSAFHGSVSTDEISKSKCSTCTPKEDNSAYWVATLFYQHRSGTLESVEQVGGVLVYYLQRTEYTGQKLHAFPPGFRMLAGNPMKRSSDNSPASRAISYNCIDYSRPTRETGAFPQKNCPQGLRAQVFFPSCWDGVNLDSPDHKSHMAYPANMEFGKCPPTHPVRMISIFYEVTFDTNKFANGWIDSSGKPYRAQPFIWSFGDNTGFGFHADFLNGWDFDVLQKAVDNCYADSGVIEECPYFTFRSDAESNTCLPEYLPEVEEKITGVMDRIPNVDVIPVAQFDPCGYSPTQGFDNTVAGQPLGNCRDTFTNKPAYIPANGAMARNLRSLPPPKPMPNPIDQTGYLGCWNDSPGGRRAMERQLSGSNHTPASCRAAVKALGSSYVVFGIQYGGECFASSSFDSYKVHGASSRCTMPCRADPNKFTFCGGPGTNQVYSVNV